MTHTRFNIRPAALVLALLVSGASSLLSASAAAAPKPTSDGKTNIWASAVPKPIQSDGSRTWATELPKPIQSDGRTTAWAS